MRPPLQQQLSFGRRTLATLSDEELRRKMEDFNDMFVTVSTFLRRSAVSIQNDRADVNQLHRTKFGHMSRLPMFSTFIYEECAPTRGWSQYLCRRTALSADNFASGRDFQFATKTVTRRMV